MIVRGVRCASAALFRKEATQKMFSGRNFTSKPLDTPGLGTLSFTVDRSHRAERYDICQKIHPLPIPINLNPPTQFTDAGKMREGRQRGVLVTLDCPTLTIYPQPASLLPHIFCCP